MNKISFVLKDAKSTKDTAIVLLYSCRDGRLKYYTGESIHPSKWPHSVPKGSQAVLSRITAAVEQTITDYKIKGEVLTKELLRARLDAILKKTTKKAKGNLFTDMRVIVDRMETGDILTQTKKRYAPSTIKRLRFTIHNLEKFMPDMQQSSITIQTYNQFIAYCQAKGYSTNYIGEFINRWKIIGKLLGGNPVFNDPKFKKLSEDTPAVFLNETELQAMADLELPARMATSRDWFIIGCFTGLRVSDLLSLKPHNVDKNFITIANEKTDTKVVIPLHPMVKAVLKKYKGFPPKITDVELNRTIKEVAKLAGLTDDVLYTVTEGGKRKDYYLKKWQMVSSHTMRRSAVTNLTRAEVKETLVMQITGIKSFATLKRYIKLSPEEAATIAAGLPFYT